MIVIQPKGKDHIAYIRRMAQDIMLMKCLSIEECIKEALEWHRNLCQKSELDDRRLERDKALLAQKQRCIHQWRLIDNGLETGAYVWQCEFCSDIEVDDDDRDG